jgi:hypothetical protein
MQIQLKAAALLQAYAKTAARRVLIARRREEETRARHVILARAQAAHVFAREAHSKKKACALLLQRRMLFALNRLAEAGVRYFVRFLWTRVRRKMMARRLQFFLQSANVRSTFLKRIAAVQKLKACIYRQKCRREYSGVTRGWGWRRLPSEILQAAVRRVLTRPVRLCWSHLNKHVVARVLQAAHRRTLAQIPHSTAFASAVCLQTHVRARNMRNLYLTANVWRSRRSAAARAPTANISQVMWLRMRNRARKESQAEAAAQLALSMRGAAGALCHRLHSQQLLGEAAVGQHVLQKLELMLLRDESCTHDCAQLVGKMKRDFMRPALAHVHLPPPPPSPPRPTSSLCDFGFVAQDSVYLLY